VAPRHCCRRDPRDFLRHDTHIGLVAAVIAEAIEAKAIVQITKKNDVVLQSDVGTPSATAATTATTTTAATTATAHCGAPAAAMCTQAASAAMCSTASAEVRVLPAAGTMRRSRIRCALTGLCSPVGAVLAGIGSTAAWLVTGLVARFGPGAGPVARFIVGTRPIAGLGAGLGARIEDLLAAVAAKIALTAISRSRLRSDARDDSRVG
jgi:hypothetical protein